MGKKKKKTKKSEGRGGGGRKKETSGSSTEHKEGTDTQGREAILRWRMTGSGRLRNCHPGHGKVIDKFFRFPVSRKMTG